MGDAIELHDYWRECPPVHLILRAVHMKDSPRRPGARSESRSERIPRSQQESFKQLVEIQRTAASAGAAMRMEQVMPDRLKALADYADEACAKMRAN